MKMKKKKLGQQYKIDFKKCRVSGLEDEKSSGEEEW